MTTVSYPLRIPEEIMMLSKLRAEQEHLDQATALRQLLYLGAEEYLLQLVSEGRISIGKAAELLHIAEAIYYRTFVSPQLDSEGAFFVRIFGAFTIYLSMICTMQHNDMVYQLVQVQIKQKKAEKQQKKFSDCYYSFFREL